LTFNPLNLFIMKQRFFEPSLYHTRRNKLAQALQDGLIVFPSNEAAGMNYRDNTYPYRQDSSFLYFCGIDRPGLFLFIDSQSGESILAGDESTMDDVVWTGPVESLHELSEHAGLDRVITLAEAKNWISNLIERNIRIHYLPVYRGDQAFRLAALLDTGAEAISGNASIPLIEAVVSLREIKEEPEIKELSDAINISRQMHITMMKSACAGMTEAEVMARVRAECLKHDLDIAYPIILTVNGQTLHNHAYHNILEHGQLLLGDFGSESSMHYAGDITRTIPVSRHFTPLQKDIYSLVLQTLSSSTAAIREGIRYLDVHLQAARIIAGGLKDLGFLNGNPDDLVAEGVHALFFPHGLGHALGLDVHDMENLGEKYTGYESGLERSTQFGLRSLRMAKTLKAGMVLTVEPGIYFIPELVALWKKNHSYPGLVNYDRIERNLPFGGIRIEDNVLVTPDRAQVLGDPIPKEIADIEQYRELAYS